MVSFAFGPAGCCCDSTCALCANATSLTATLAGVANTTGATSSFIPILCYLTNTAAFNRTFHLCYQGGCRWSCQFPVAGPGEDAYDSRYDCCDTICELIIQLDDAGGLTAYIQTVTGVCPGSPTSPAIYIIPVNIFVDFARTVIPDPGHLCEFGDDGTVLPFATQWETALDFTHATLTVQSPVSGSCPTGCSTATAVVQGITDGAPVAGICSGGCNTAFDATYNGISMEGSTDTTCTGSKSFALSSTFCGYAVGMDRTMDISISYDSGSNVTTITAVLDWSATVTGYGAASGSITWLQTYNAELSAGDIDGLVLPYSTSTDVGGYCVYSSSTCTVSLN